jgi:hypothetical protein
VAQQRVGGSLHMRGVGWGAANQLNVVQDAAKKNIGQHSRLKKWPSSVLVAACREDKCAYAGRWYAAGGKTGE